MTLDRQTDKVHVEITRKGLAFACPTAYKTMSMGGVMAGRSHVNHDVIMSMGSYVTPISGTRGADSSRL